MADNLSIKDGAGNTVVKATKDIGAGVQLEKVLLADATGTPIVTLPVTASVLPLPTGAATSAGQTDTTAAVNATASADRWAGVTPSDTTDLTAVPKALYIGVAGNISLTGADGATSTFIVASGQTVPLRPRRVRTTGTTATGIVALY